MVVDGLLLSSRAIAEFGGGILFAPDLTDDVAFVKRFLGSWNAMVNKIREDEQETMKVCVQKNLEGKVELQGLSQLCKVTSMV